MAARTATIDDSAEMTQLLWVIEAYRRVVHKTLDLGITLFDTADIYGEKGGSETCLDLLPHLKMLPKGVVSYRCGGWPDAGRA